MKSLTSIHTALARTAGALVCGFLTTSPASASADPGITTMPAQISKWLSLAAYDLSSPRGVQLAQERIEKDARHLCRSLGDTRKVEDREAFAACFTEAMGKASRQFDALVDAANRHGQSDQFARR